MLGTEFGAELPSYCNVLSEFIRQSCHQFEVIRFPACGRHAVINVQQIAAEGPMFVLAQISLDADLTIDDIVTEVIHLRKPLDRLPNPRAIAQSMMKLFAHSQSCIVFSLIAQLLKHVARANLQAQVRRLGLNEVIAGTDTQDGPVLDIRDAIMEPFNAAITIPPFSKEMIVLNEAVDGFGIFRVYSVDRGLAIGTVRTKA